MTEAELNAWNDGNNAGVSQCQRETAKGVVGAAQDGQLLYWLATSLGRQHPSMTRDEFYDLLREGVIRELFS